jgi:general secretion pathway protein G
MKGLASAGAVRRGFSLIELMVALAVMGVLAVAAVPMLEIAAQRGRERELRQALWEIRDAIDRHKRAADAGTVEKSGDGYPKTLQSLVDGVPSLAGGGGRHYFLRRIPRDPFAPDALPAERGWGLRSYRSEPTQPQPGDDVYDVYSRSERLALDGTPLKAW